MKKYIRYFALFIVCVFTFSFNYKKNLSNFKCSSDIIKTNDSVVLDSLAVFKPYKEKVHASYYSDKLNGRKTANGDVFDNNLYTAAHKKLPFGTLLKITNTLNDEWVIVTVNDRGPFVKGREIDLSKKAFMQIAKFKTRGYLIVNIETVEQNFTKF